MQLRERRKGRGGNSLFSVVLKNNFETFHRIQKQTPVVDSFTTKWLCHGGIFVNTLKCFRTELLQNTSAFKRLHKANRKWNRSIPTGVLCAKTVLKSFTNVLGKTSLMERFLHYISYLFSEVFRNNCVTQENTCSNCSSKRLWHRCFLMNFAKFLRTLITEHIRWLLLRGASFRTLFNFYDGAKDSALFLQKTSS